MPHLSTADIGPQVSQIQETLTERWEGNIRQACTYRWGPELVDAQGWLPCRSCRELPTCSLTHSSFPTKTLHTHKKALYYQSVVFLSDLRTTCAWQVDQRSCCKSLGSHSTSQDPSHAAMRMPNLTHCMERQECGTPLSINRGLDA